MAPTSTWPLALTFLFGILLLEPSSGAFLDMSYGSSQGKLILSSSVIASEYRALVTEQRRVYLFLKPFGCRAARLAGSLVNGALVPASLGLNVTNVVVTADERQLGALRCTLESIQASVAAAGLARRVTTSPELSLPSLRRIVAEKHGGRRKKQWREVVEFVRRSGSFVQVEMEAAASGDGDGGGRGRGELAVAAVVQEAIGVADAAGGLGDDVAVVLHLRSRQAPSAAEMAALIGGGATTRGKMLLGLLVEVSSSSRRELAGARTVAHDVFAPVTNPATMPATNPVTVPATNPVSVSPGIVTVPSTNPGMGYATNPNLPPLYPEPTTPATMPDPTTTTPAPFMNPVTAPATPITNPAAPVANPATTPTTYPGTSPVTNPTTTYPYPQQGSGFGGGTPTTMPTFQPPATTMPGVGAGQSWCVAKTGVMDMALQSGLDYACGNGADCSAIQPMGSCYNPNTLQAHASYAFNSYFQRYSSPASCDFGGAGMLVAINPSSGTCMFQTSAGFGGGYSPAVSGGSPVGTTTTGPGIGMGMGTGTAAGGGSGSTVLNANGPGGSSMYGSDNPAGLTTAGAAASPSGGWALALIWIATFAYVKEKV